jgi:hypothetical protein
MEGKRSIVKSLRLTPEEGGLVEYVAGLYGKDASDFLRDCFLEWVAMHRQEIAEKSYHLNQILNRVEKSSPSEAELFKAQTLYKGVDPILIAKAERFTREAKRLGVGYAFAVGLVTQSEVEDKINLAFLKSFAEEYEKIQKEKSLGEHFRLLRKKYFGEGGEENE